MIFIKIDNRENFISHNVKSLINEVTTQIENHTNYTLEAHNLKFD